MSDSFKIVPLQQRTQEWHDWRKNGIGASDANVVMSGRHGADNLLNIKIGLDEENDFQSPAMKRGADLEDEARVAYIVKIGLEVNPACVQSRRFAWLRASLDGISEDYTKVVEIKCGEKTYEAVKESRSVPNHYYAQTQHILSVTGLESLDFWCYSPDSPGILLTVPRDENYIRQLLRREETFWDKVAEHFWQNRDWGPEIMHELIEKLCLQPRTLNCLKRAHISKVGHVLEMPDEELLRVRNLGPNSVTELKQKLEEFRTTYFVTPTSSISSSPLPEDKVVLGRVNREKTFRAPHGQLTVHESHNGDIVFKGACVDELPGITYMAVLMPLNPATGEVLKVVQVDLASFIDSDDLDDPTEDKVTLGRVNWEITFRAPHGQLTVYESPNGDIVFEGDCVDENGLSYTTVFMPLNPTTGEVLKVVQVDLASLIDSDDLGDDENFDDLTLNSFIPPSNRGIRSLISETRDLAGLTELNLNHKQLTELPPEIGNLSNLTTLNLSRNRLTALPPEIGSLSNLTTLDLHDNQLTALPPEIGNLTNLTTLDLRDNQLTALPPEISDLTNLTTLYLSRNQLTALPREIGSLTGLGVLWLQDNQLTALPPEFGNLTGLFWLHLYRNQLTALPPEIGELTNLTTLYLRGNQLTALPPEIGNLTNLTDLNLYHNLLTALPPEIGNLTNLTTLNLDGNRLTALPPEIGSLTNLATLDLRRNQLTALPPEIGNLTGLTTLVLAYNQLTALPSEIGSLTNLTGLNLYHNQLTALPPEIGNLTTLRALQLYINQLTALPPQLGNLAGLTNLYLQRNRLTGVPVTLCQLTKLKELNLSDNLLTVLPPCMAELIDQGVVNLSGNPLRGQQVVEKIHEGRRGTD